MAVNLETAFRRLLDRISNLEMTVQRQQTRVNNLFREGEVESVDEKNYTAIVKAHGIESKPSPWLQQAGEINEWTPLSKGQRVVLVSPGGDMGRSFIIPGGFTDAVPQPDETPGQKRVTIGKAAITHNRDGFVLDVDGAKFTQTKNGWEFEIDGEKLQFTRDGLKHNGKNIGKDHKHETAPPGPPGPPI
ncbi:phage baseplate assembly protein V [Agrobacterium tumefaciens]|uniref:phage baseplate assembly protein V n=1 Tax=Agrobacterium tumefaciens TaxID=358 RepID=UPI001573920E|nr:phage baseplate assembly protein V [Agrobacterium tumefaciens]NTD85491.1 hypothetical protein [Agrobacterium tumefaciens]NTD90840.1 hypothetical protein [Agrobacterium tumefaciens]NTE03662.1 hypothetical protein [Agrobacterium tumefaciens]NTE15914.1 hypothetical protein [Agrobacterium tumefaciens]NTE26488.1 hypothetical protein [Agrobacterium tumefaciens]